VRKGLVQAQMPAPNNAKEKRRFFELAPRMKSLTWVFSLMTFSYNGYQKKRIECFLLQSRNIALFFVGVER